MATEYNARWGAAYTAAHTVLSAGAVDAQTLAQAIADAIEAALGVPTPPVVDSPLAKCQLRSDVWQQGPEATARVTCITHGLHASSDTMPHGHAWEQRRQALARLVDVHQELALAVTQRQGETAR